MSLGSSLYTYVQAQSSITDLIGNKFRPQIALPGDDLPLTLYRRSSRGRTPIASGDTGQVTTTVVMTHFADTYAEAESVAEAFRTKLNGKTGTVGTENFRSCFLVLESDELESLQFAQNDAPYFITQEYQIVHTETQTGL